MKWIIISFAFILMVPAKLFGQIGAINGWCEKGATAALTSGLQSSNALQGVVPGGNNGCLVTVYITGTTTPATIYSDSSGGDLSNPFNAHTNGQWLFFSDQGQQYDVVMSGGIPPNTYTTPVTLTGVGSSGGGGGSVTSVALSAPSAFTVAGSPVTSNGTLALDWTNNTSLYLGQFAGFFGGSSARNVAVGEAAGEGNRTGTDITSIGYQAGTGESAGSGSASGNTFIGSTTPAASGYGPNNTFIGNNIGGTCGAPGCESDVLVGNSTDVKFLGDTNEIAIGYAAIGNGSNTVTLGNGSITNVYGIGFTDPTATVSNLPTCFYGPNGALTNVGCSGGGGSGITLTTTGSSGPATLTGGVLNVPEYVPSSGGYLLTNPSGSQTVAQPSSTNLTITTGYTAYVFKPQGTSSVTTLTNAWSGGAIQNNHNFIAGQQGINQGNNGTSLQGWTGGTANTNQELCAVPGICQLFSGGIGHTAVGDTADIYNYMQSFGGIPDSSAEGSTFFVGQPYQIGQYSGTITSGGTTGSSLIITNGPTCYTLSGGCTADVDYGARYANGGMMLDESQGGATASILSYDYNAALRSREYVVSGITLTPSTAEGTIIQSSCTGNKTTPDQTLVSTTCNITLGPDSLTPGVYGVTGTYISGTSGPVFGDIFLAGPSQEESAITAVQAPSGGVQQITFSTAKAWDNLHGNTDAATVMQGGPGGQAFVQTGAAWQPAFQVIGATDASHLEFALCVKGGCNGSGLSNSIPPPYTVSGTTTLVRLANVVTSTSTGLDNFTLPSSIVVTSCSNADMDGTFALVTNSNDTFNPIMTWNQTGGNETSTGCVLSTAPLGITFYPMAFINGTNGGVAGDAQLGTNQVAWANGDAVVGAPAAEFQGAGINIYMGQDTADDPSQQSHGISVSDRGGSPMRYDFQAIETPSNGIGGAMFDAEGSWKNLFYIKYRPANNGTLLYVQGGEPVSSNTKPYYIFQDNGTSGQILFTPSNSTFTFNHDSILGQDTTINGVDCPLNGTGCTLPAYCAGFSCANHNQNNPYFTTNTITTTTPLTATGLTITFPSTAGFVAPACGSAYADGVTINEKLCWDTMDATHLYLNSTSERGLNGTTASNFTSGLTIAGLYFSQAPKPTSKDTLDILANGKIGYNGDINDQLGAGLQLPSGTFFGGQIYGYGPIIDEGNLSVQGATQLGNVYPDGTNSCGYNYGCIGVYNTSATPATAPSGAYGALSLTSSGAYYSYNGSTPALLAAIPLTPTVTLGTGVTSATCATAACTNRRGEYTVVGGTFTTGTVFSMAWTATSAAYVCSATQNGGATYLGIGSSVATTTGVNITSDITVAGTTFNVSYSCQP